MDYDTPHSPRAAELASWIKRWLRTRRKRMGVVPMALAQAAGVAREVVLRWEMSSVPEIPSPAELLRLAQALDTPVDMLPFPLRTYVAGEPVPVDPLKGGEGLYGEVVGPLLSSEDEIKKWMIAARVRAGMSRRELAAALDVSYMTVRQWELEGERPPRPKYLAAIAAACGVPVPRQPDGADEALARFEAQEAPAHLAEEVARVGELLLAARPFGRDAARNVEWFSTYYAGGRTLQETGDLHGVTRARVGQVVSRMVEALPAIAVPRAQYDALVTRCRALDPAPLADVEAALADVLGGMTLQAARRYGKDVLGEDLPLMLHAYEGGEFVVRPEGPAWIDEALSQSRRLLRAHGAALFDQAWAITQAECGERIDPAQLRAALSGVPGFAWLDEGHHWFWFGPDDGPNRALLWSRRILDAAGGPVDIEHVHAGLSRFAHRDEDQRRFGFVLPPATVLLELLRGCTDIEVTQHNDVKLITHDRVHTGDEGLVHGLIAAMSKHGGVMSMSELRGEFVEGKGVPQVSMMALLARSPLIRKVDRAVYAIRGARLEPERLLQAQLSASATTIAVTMRSDAGLEWNLTLTASALVNRQMIVPRQARNVPAGHYDVVGGGRVEITVDGDDRYVRGGVRALTDRGAAAGDTFRVVLWTSRSTIAFEPT